MFTGFEYEAIAAENKKDFERALKHAANVEEAKKGRGSNKRRSSKLLVKLASLLIRSGEYLMAQAKQDIQSAFPGASLQNM